VSKKHPTIQTQLTLEDYLEASHILVTYTADLHGGVDRFLSAKGLKCKVVLSLPYHLAVPLIVAQTSLITTIAERIALATQWEGLQIFPSATIARPNSQILRQIDSNPVAVDAAKENKPLPVRLLDIASVNVAGYSSCIFKVSSIFNCFNFLTRVKFSRAA
jgi:hypothetical protein